MDIRANSILPARREDIELQTADGLTLVGELALPADQDPVATLICLHPLPTHGGMMDSHVFRKAAWRLPALAGLAVLRFNTRGTTSVRGTSEGAFDAGAAERLCNVTYHRVKGHGRDADGAGPGRMLVRAGDRHRRKEVHGIRRGDLPGHGTGDERVGRQRKERTVLLEAPDRKDGDLR